MHRSHINLIRRCKTQDWRVSLLFLWLPSSQAALDRVAKRVREGGHSIPGDVVVRRYWAGLANFRRFYLPLADVALIYDNSDRGPILVADRAQGPPRAIHDEARWTKIAGTPG